VLIFLRGGGGKKGELGREQVSAQWPVEHGSLLSKGEKWNRNMLACQGKTVGCFVYLFTEKGKYSRKGGGSLQVCGATGGEEVRGEGVFKNFSRAETGGGVPPGGHNTAGGVLFRGGIRWV